MGSTSTILWHRYKIASQGYTGKDRFLPTNLAMLLLAGVLSDTVNLSSPTIKALSSHLVVVLNIVLVLEHRHYSQ